MEHYVKKYFWVLGAVVVVICSILTAKAVNHYIAGKYLGDSAEAKKAPVKQSATNKTQRRSKNGEPLATRNMFCSDCIVEEEEPETPVDGDTVPLTKLPLQLVATNLSTRPEHSFATIRNNDSENQGAYWVGDEIPDAGTVESIGGKYVDFRRENKRLERIALLSNAPTPKKTTPRPRPRARSRKSDLVAKLDAGIKKVDDDKYEIDRALVDEFIENPMAVARGARIVPSVKNGKPNGFKLYAIRPSSAYAKLGLRNGDTVHAINGFELTTPDKALEVYSKIKESSNLSVSVTRRGKPVSLSYSIR